MLGLEIRVASGVDIAILYRVLIVDMGLIAATMFADTVSDSQKRRGSNLARGKYGSRKVRVYPAECGERLGKIPAKNGSSNFFLF